MTTEELKEWEVFYRQYKNGYHLSKHDWMTFIRLNHLVMEASHEVHNDNMLEDPRYKLDSGEWGMLEG